MERITPIWKDEEVWILGGGASLAEQFDIPADIVAGVKDGSLPMSRFSHYLRPLHRRKTIGVNAAYLIGSWLDIIFFHDEEFWIANKERLECYPAPLISCNSRFAMRAHEKVLYIPKDRSKPYGISDDPKQICWNHNSGAAAITVAANLGAKKIILIGFDMTAQGGTHFHNEYKLKKLPPYEKHLLGFPQIAADARRRGIEIINASPNSAITAFPKMTVKEILK